MNDEDDDIIDVDNFRGIYFNSKHDDKYFDEVTGAHFEYNDLCNRLRSLLPKQ